MRACVLYFLVYKVSTNYYIIYQAYISNKKLKATIILDHINIWKVKAYGNQIRDKTSMKIIIIIMLVEISRFTSRGEIIEFAEHLKILSLTLTCHLNWSTNAKVIVKRSNKEYNYCGLSGALYRWSTSRRTSFEVYWISLVRSGDPYIERK